MRSPSNRSVLRRGFTLVEVLIVVVILGILAATVLPQFTAATDDAKEAALRQNLQQMRTQIDLFKMQHGGVLPAYNKTTEDDFKKAMLLTTDTAGNLGTGAALGPPVVTGSGPYGPYLLGQVPPNPLNGLNTVKVGTTTDKSGTTGWSYNSVTGEFKGNFADTEMSHDGKVQLNSL